jgi:hypothetical protein
LVQGRPRVAPMHLGDSWRDTEQLSPRTEHLSDSERDSLAEQWIRMGQMEHASIAAFARFNLQLLALGAPPELLEASTRALADETAHAKLCFSLASAYAGYAVGPAALDISNSLEQPALGDVLDLVIAEGCFGETSAALAALEAAELAADPVIASAHLRIARDEERHAALAFRFVRWALEREPSLEARAAKALNDYRSAAPEVRDVVHSCFEALSSAARQSSRANHAA